LLALVPFTQAQHTSKINCVAELESELCTIMERHEIRNYKSGFRSLLKDAIATAKVAFDVEAHKYCINKEEYTSVSTAIRKAGEKEVPESVKPYGATGTLVHLNLAYFLTFRDGTCPEGLMIYRWLAEKLRHILGMSHSDLYTEVTVFNADLKIAGTADVILTVPDEKNSGKTPIYIVDHKTATRLQASYLEQLNLYAELLRSMLLNDARTIRMFIYHVPRDALNSGNTEMVKLYEVNSPYLGKNGSDDHAYIEGV
jgi:hypothetical protein